MGSKPPERPLAPQMASQEEVEKMLRHERRRKQRAQLLGTIVVGGAVLGGGFAYLGKDKTPATEAIASNEQPAAAQPKAAADAKKTALDSIPAAGSTSSNSGDYSLFGSRTASGSSREIVGPFGKPTDGIAAKEAEPETTPDMPQSAAALSFDEEPALVLTGADALRDAAKLRDRQLFDRAVEDKIWTSYRGLLQRSIESALKEVRPGSSLAEFDGVWREPALVQAILRWKTIGFFTEKALAEHVPGLEMASCVRWIMNDTAAMEELATTVTKFDDGESVLKLLMEFHAVNREEFPRFYTLALACAVVFDEPMSIANAIGTDEFPAESEVDPVKRYQWYMEKDAAGKLASRVHHVPARDLVWVVSAPITTAEMEWAISKVHGSRKNWGSNYGRIVYLMERAVEGLNPYKEYSFAEILKEGGICGDQSYFCANTARAQGIPAMILSGETDLGGHAWAAVKTDDRTWDNSIGRIGGVSKGETTNPQTGDRMTEQEVLQWNHRQYQDASTGLSMNRHLWLAQVFESLGDKPKQANAIRLANRIGSAFPESWQALFAVLKQESKMPEGADAPANPEAWQAFVKDMRLEFKDNPRIAELASVAESEFIMPFGEMADARRSLLRDRRRMDRNASEQTDLVATSLKREADLLMSQNGAEGIRDVSQLYDRSLRNYGDSITGFKMMADDYFNFCKHDPTLAKKAARDIESAFRRVVETGTKDWFRAKTESDIYRTICGYYRSAGEPERADMLEKRIDVLMRRAKRGAI